MSLYLFMNVLLIFVYMIDDKPITHVLPLQSDDQDGAFKAQSSV